MEEHFYVAVVSETSHESQYDPLRAAGSVCVRDVGLKTFSWVSAQLIMRTANGANELQCSHQHHLN